MIFLRRIGVDENDKICKKMLFSWDLCQESGQLLEGVFN